MQISNSKNYEDADMHVTPRDLAIIFNSINLGIQTQLDICNELFNEYSWILPSKYIMKKNGKKCFFEDTLYQKDYMHHKKEIDQSLIEVKKDATDSGIDLKKDNLTDDYKMISAFFKELWLKVNILNSSHTVRAKLRTILKKYNLERRSDRFCNYFDRCMDYYKLECTVCGKSIDIRNISVDDMITFKAIQS